MKLKNNLIYLFLSFFIFNACSFYSFTGYDITAETANVGIFENQAPIQSVELSQTFTNKLEQKLIRETPLQLIKDEGQLQFSGAITGYSLRAASVSGVEETEQTELKITVQVNYKNTLNEDKSFNESFSASEVYDSNQDLAAVEEDLLDSISDQLVQVIFNRAFIDW